MSRWLFGLLALVCLVPIGCMTYSHHASKIRSTYIMGNLEQAKEQAKASESDSRYTDVSRLERATLLLCEGQVQEAERLFREVRDRFDHLEQKDVGEQALSMLTDDQYQAYPGEDYEKVLLRCYLALANLLGEGDDATAYALQVTQKQQEIIARGVGPDGKNPKEGYKRVAAGAYLHAALREETHQHYDDAARSLTQVCAWVPEFTVAKEDLKRVQTGHHSAQGHGVLYVFALVGKGPWKVETMEVPTTAALLVADRILTAVGKHSLPPTVAPIKVPRVVVPPSDVQAVQVQVAGRPCGQTATLTDVGKLAVAQAEALHAEVLGRAIARRVLKKALVVGTKEVTNVEPTGLASLALDIGGVVWEATESADTRCWSLLPAKIQVLRLELPVGTHAINLQPVGASGVPCGPSCQATVEVPDGRNAYMLASFPTGQLVGRVVTGPGCSCRDDREDWETYSLGPVSVSFQPRR